MTKQKTIAKSNIDFNKTAQGNEKLCSEAVLKRTANKQF